MDLETLFGDKHLLDALASVDQNGKHGIAKVGRITHDNSPIEITLDWIAWKNAFGSFVFSHTNETLVARKQKTTVHDEGGGNWRLSCGEWSIIFHTHHSPIRINQIRGMPEWLLKDMR